MRHLNTAEIIHIAVEAHKSCQEVLDNKIEYKKVERFAIWISNNKEFESLDKYVSAIVELYKLSIDDFLGKKELMEVKKTLEYERSVLGGKLIEMENKYCWTIRDLKEKNKLLESQNISLQLELQMIRCAIEELKKYKKDDSATHYVPPYPADYK